MPKEITLKLYTIDELSPAAKEKARQWFRAGWDSNDSGQITNSIREHVSINHGLESEDYEPGTIEAENEKKQSLKIFWSLSSCQGDGVAFDGRPDLDALSKKQPEIRKLLARLKRLGGHVDVSIKHSGRYCHWNSMEVEVRAGSEEHEKETDKKYRAREEKIDGIGEDLRESLAELLKTISRDAEKAGYAEIEYRQSDEQVDEDIEANEYTFLENGKRFSA